MHWDVNNSPKATSHFTNSSNLIFFLVGLNISSLSARHWCVVGGSPVISVSLEALPPYPLFTNTAYPVVLWDCTGVMLSHEYLGTFLKQSKKKKKHLTLSSGRRHSIKYLFLKQHWNMFMCLTCILNNQSYSRFLQSGQVCNPSTLSLNFSSPIDSLARAKHLCSHDCFQSQVKAVCGKRAGFKKWMGPRYPQSILRAVNIRTLLSFPYAFLGKPASKLTQCTHTGKYIWEMSFEIHPFIVSVII